MKLKLLLGLALVWGAGGRDLQIFYKFPVGWWDLSGNFDA